MTAAARAWLRRNWVGLVCLVIIVMGIIAVFKVLTYRNPYKAWDTSYEVGEGVWEADIIVEPVTGAEADRKIDFFIIYRRDIYNEKRV